MNGPFARFFGTRHAHDGMIVTLVVAFLVAGLLTAGASDAALRFWTECGVPVFCLGAGVLMGRGR